MSFVCDWQPVDAMIRLLTLTDLERELWIDSRIVGMPMHALAARDNVTVQAISLRLQKIERKLDAAQQPACEAIAA